MAYYYYQFEQMGHAAYNDPQHGYSTFLGQFIRPIVGPHPHLLYYFQRAGTTVQLCFEVNDGAEIAHEITDRAANLTIAITRQPDANDSLVGHFGSPGARFLAANHGAQTNPVQRARLVLRYLNAISALMLDNLVDQNNGQWRFEFNYGESNQNGVILRENPLGNNFESLAHLLANITGFKFDIEVTPQGQLRTAWMAQACDLAGQSFRCQI